MPLNIIQSAVGATDTATLTNKTLDGDDNTLQDISVLSLANGIAGELLTWSASGSPNTVTTGTATHVLTSNGAGLEPTFQILPDAGAAIKGVVELATASETTTGTDTARAITPDALAGSIYGQEVVSILVFDDSQDTAVADGAGDVFFRVPSKLNGWDLIEVAAQVQTAGTTGTTDIQIYNVSQAVDMLSTVITIDSTETDSKTAATPAVIDTTNDDVSTGDSIRIDVDAVSTTAAKGLLVELTFRLP